MKEGLMTIETMDKRGRTRRKLVLGTVAGMAFPAMSASTVAAEGKSKMRIDRFDHMVLTVLDIEATCKFYELACGMEVETFGQGRKALKFGQQKINLHL